MLEVTTDAPLNLAMLRAGQRLRGVIPGKTVTLIAVDPIDTDLVEVFYRDGLYYFLWSQDDTRSENYQVRYAYAKSPLGPLTIPENNTVIIKDPSQEIYGTGHNSVLKVHDKDEWYIVYHRISRPDGIKKSYPGTSREVCIDPLEFNEDGSIRQVVPSL